MSHHFFALLNKYHISPNQFAVLWYFSNKVACPKEIEHPLVILAFLQSSDFLDGQRRPTAQGDNLLSDVDALFKKVKALPTTKTLGLSYVDEIQKYRDKFPPNRKASVDEVGKKFATLFTRIPKLTWEIVQEATTIYIASLSEERYCQKAGNFIEDYKNGGSSNIQEYIERVMKGEQSTPAVVLGLKFAS